MTDNQPFDQSVRNFIYQYFVEQARPPSVAEAAAALGVEAEEVAAAYRRLHQKHALFLEPGSEPALLPGGGEPQVRLANPFSAVPTLFRVHTPHQSYWANCAWDMLGIPAALDSGAMIQATCACCGEPSLITVAGDQLAFNGEIAHFLVPFRHWYDDLVFT